MTYRAVRLAAPCAALVSPRFMPSAGMCLGNAVAIAGVRVFAEAYPRN